MGSSLRAGLGLAAIALAIAPGTASAVTSVSLGPDVGGTWELGGQSDCVEPPNILWGSVFYAALDAGGTMPLTGQTRDVAGNLIGGRQVTVFLEGFRTKDTAANAKRFVTHSGPDGVWHLRIPGRDLTRDKFAWAQVPDSELAPTGFVCFDNDWELDPGISLPFVMNTRTTIKLAHRKLKVKGKSVTVQARLNAVDPVHAGPVLLQRLNHGRWRNMLSTRRRDAHGRFSVRVKLAKPGTYQFRLVFKPDARKGDYVLDAERRFKVVYPKPPRRVRRPAPTLSVSEGVSIEKTPTVPPPAFGCAGVSCTV